MPDLEPGPSDGSVLVCPPGLEAGRGWVGVLREPPEPPTSSAAAEVGGSEKGVDAATRHCREWRNACLRLGSSGWETRQGCYLGTVLLDDLPQNGPVLEAAPRKLTD